MRSLMPYWYRPKMSRDIAIETVLGLLSGEFIVRDSSTVIGGYALTLKLNEDSLRMWKKMDASMLTLTQRVRADSGIAHWWELFVSNLVGKKKVSVVATYQLHFASQ